MRTFSPQELLPHRYPFLMLDRIVLIDFGVRAVTIKNFAHSERFGGFAPVAMLCIPGVAIVECMAQTAALIFASRPDRNAAVAIDARHYLALVKDMIFHRDVACGDQVILEVSLMKRLGELMEVRGEARVDSELIASGILVLATSAGRR